MKRLSILLFVCATGLARAGVVNATYNFNVTANTGSSTIRDLEFFCGGPFAEGGGWGLSTSFYNGGPGTNSDTLNISADFGANYTPILQHSIFFGVIDTLPSDSPASNEVATQKHLVLFMDPLSALNVQNIAFGTVMPTTNEDALINAIETVHRSDLTDDQKRPYYENYIYPFYTNADHALAGAGGLERSLYFNANSDFSIVFFSNGQIAGSGTSTATTTPEPATMAILGVGVLGLLRKRRAN